MDWNGDNDEPTDKAHKIANEYRGGGHDVQSTGREVAQAGDVVHDQGQRLQRVSL